MIIGRICIKLMYEDLNKLLISRFDLILGPIKGLIMFNN
jgi:hypothetical protein